MMMAMPMMKEVSPKRRYQVRQTSEPVRPAPPMIRTGYDSSPSDSPKATRPPRDTRPLSIACGTRIEEGELLEEPPVALQLMRKLSTSAPELSPSQTTVLNETYMRQSSREETRGNRRLQVIGMDDDEEEIHIIGGEDGEGIYSKLNHYSCSSNDGVKCRLAGDEERCSPESQYSRLNIIQDSSSQQRQVNDYSYIDIDIIKDKREHTNSQSTDLPGHNYFVLEIPDDQCPDEDDYVEEEERNAAAATSSGTGKPKTAGQANIKSTKAGNKIYSYVDINMCRVQPPAKGWNRTKSHPPVSHQVSEYEQPIRLVKTPQKYYKPLSVHSNHVMGVANRGASPQKSLDGQRRALSPVMTHAVQPRPLPTSSSSHHISSLHSSRTSPPRGPVSSPSPPLVSPRTVSPRSPPFRVMSPVSPHVSPVKRSPCSPRTMSPSPSFTYTSSAYTPVTPFPRNHTPSPRNHSPSRSRYYSSSSSSRDYIDGTHKSPSPFKRGGTYSSQKLRGERIFTGNTERRVDDSSHENLVGIIITENGPVLLPSKRSPTSPKGMQVTGNAVTDPSGERMVDGSGVGSTGSVEEEGHYEFDPNFVNQSLKQ